MLEAGMVDGVILVADRALKPRRCCIVVAQVDNDLTVKTLHKRAHRVKLVPPNPTFPEIAFREGQQIITCGLVPTALKLCALIEPSLLCCNPGRPSALPFRICVRCGTYMP